MPKSISPENRTARKIIFSHSRALGDTVMFTAGVRDFNLLYLGEKEINLLGNLHTQGGGEQSLCTIAKVLQDAGWKANLYPFRGIHEKFRCSNLNIIDYSFVNGGMTERMKPGLPLLYYANDTTGWFIERGQDIVANSSGVIIGINYVNRPIPTCKWLSDSGKLRAVIFQNQEKMAEFERDMIGYNGVKLISLYGAVDLKPFLDIPIKACKDGEPLIVLKHCMPDYRKYITKESEGRGDKIHVWQKNLAKDRDVRFYRRLLKDLGGGVRFEFMQAHREIEEEFRNEPRMVFHKWDSMPVTDFLANGHIYLYRTSNLWRDQYPRVVAEALAAGLPVFSEPRDGTMERISHGDTGFYCVDFDSFLWALKLLRRKENYRQEMGRKAKKWARVNLDPRRWVDVIEQILS